MIIIAALLHVIGLAAYIFNYIPERIQSMYFYNLDRVYILFLIGCFYYLSQDRIIKIGLLLSGLIYLIYFHIANIQYIINISYNIAEWIWVLFTGISFIVILIYIRYVTR